MSFSFKELIEKNPEYGTCIYGVKRKSIQQKKDLFNLRKTKVPEYFMQKVELTYTNCENSAE
jgi:hypothetical protein